MTELFLHGREAKTVFDLLGHDENDITFSVGWALAQSDSFLRGLIRHIFPGQPIGQIGGIYLQDHAEDGGYTDIEVVADHAHLIIEAKRGWNLPSNRQLEKYAPRLRGKTANRAIAVIAECTPAYARSKLPKATKVIPVCYLSWKQVSQITHQSASSGTQAAKRLLLELGQYLEEVMATQRQTSNLVYVLALSADMAEWSKLSWIKFVTKKNRYFHPFRSGWPKEPPNYLGFRYEGKLQSIHHVEQCEIVTDLSDYIPEINGRKWRASRGSDSYFLYKLGPAILPDHEIQTGNIYRNGRVWAAIDLLLTCKTISEARDRTKKRLGETS